MPKEGRTQLGELRMIALLRQIGDPDDSEGALWAGMRVHRVAGDLMVDLGYSSKTSFACFGTPGEPPQNRFLRRTVQICANAPPMISMCC
jgi:hypothetical protein